ncbi:multicopper oxidase family protein [Azospirillum doebereinerae]
MLKHWLEKRTVSRRAALLGGSAAIATAVVAPGGTGGALAQAASHSGHAMTHPGMLGTRIRTPEARAQAALARNGQAPALTADALPTPPVLSLASGISGTLPMKAQSYQLGDRPAKNLRVYDNLSAPQYLMGPTLEMTQTGRFTVTLANGLPLNPDQDQPHVVNIPSQFNTTNLHTHGLHVSPDSPSDNVYLEVLPQGTDAKYADGVTSFVGDFTYTFDLKNHTPGTFWYHPHRHGSVAVQVASGAAGALIVRGGQGTVDTVPGIAGVTEQVLLIQQVLLDANGELPDFDTIWNASQVAAADWTVNGTIGRTLAMQPGEVQRWRIVNTGFQAEARFSLVIQGVQTASVAGSGSFPDIDVTLIAMDGVNLTTAPTVKAVYLPPGGRADILVKAPDTPVRLLAQAGRYIPFDANGVPEGNSIEAGFAIDGVWQEAAFSETPTVLFTVNVAGPAKPMTLPSNPLPKPLVPDITAATRPDNYRYVNFDVTAFTNPLVKADASNGLPSYNPGAIPQVFKLQINGELFCPGRIMFQPPLDSVDQYFVDSPGLHVFHIHVNPFLVTEVNGKPLSTPMWRDTMLAGPNGYKALTKYTDYSGSFPIHCHILDHEDAGMMTNVAVVDKADPAGAFPKHGKH